jgi:hypothetical protein
MAVLPNSCPVQIALSMFWPSYSLFLPVLAVISCYPVLAFLSRLYSLPVLSLLSCSDHPLQSVLSQTPCVGTDCPVPAVLTVLSWPSCSCPPVPNRSVLTVLFWLLGCPCMAGFQFQIFGENFVNKVRYLYIFKISITFSMSWIFYMTF